MLQAWNEFWFANNDYYELGIFRILILSYFLFFKLNSREFDFHAWLKAKRQIRKYWLKPWLIKIFRFPDLGHNIEGHLIKVYKISIFICILGFATQFFAGISFLAGLYLLSIPQGLKIRQTILPIHFILLGLTLAPSGAFLSIDSILFPKTIDASLLSEISWGCQYIRVVICIVICATGISKLRHIRLSEGFLSRGNLSTLCRLHDFKYFYVTPMISVSQPLTKYPLLEKVTAGSTLAIEVLFPLVLFSFLAKLILVPAMIAMIIGFRIFLGPRFDFLNICIFVCFLPWSLLINNFS